MKLFVRDLTVIDVSLLSKERGLVGESWLVDIELTGELNEMSMLLDFARVKKQIKSIIDAEVDHRLLVPQQERSVQITNTPEGDVWLDFVPTSGRSLHLRAPGQAFCLIPSAVVDIDAVTAYLQKMIRHHLPNNIEGLVIRLRPEAITGAFYHYSHGLKKHDGNCQRIAHGHRSMIELWVDGARDALLERQWAQRWADIYLGSRDDLVDATTLQLSPVAQRELTTAHLGFSYHAPQGLFQLAIHADVCELIDTDTTVELLADYIARQLAPQLDGSTLNVVAYEGVGKGAIATY